MDTQACDQLLVMLVVQLLCGPRRPLDGTDKEIEALLMRLRVRYVTLDTPYGDHEQGFRRWLLDCWPAPPMA